MMSNMAGICRLLRTRSPPLHCLRSFKRDAAMSPLPPIGRDSNAGVILKGVISAGAFCTASYVGCTIWEYENHLRLKNNLGEWIKSTFQSQKRGTWRQEANEWWRQRSGGERLFWKIFAVNGAVFALWQLPQCRYFMVRFFTSSPKSVGLPLVFCTFSHANLMHFGMNMYVLHTFCPSVYNALGVEQTLNMYLMCGVFSSLASLVFRALIAAPPSVSLGASGAILGLLGYVATSRPDGELCIVFLPSVTFSAQSGLFGLMALDTLGLIFRWKLFDHAAHLGGALAGMAYAHYGRKLWLERKPVAQQWHEFRKIFTEKDR